MRNNADKDQNVEIITQTQMLSRHRWCNLAWTLRNYVMSSLNNLPDLACGKMWVIESICALGKLAQPHFANGSVIRFTGALYALFSLLDDKMTLIKSTSSIPDTAQLDGVVITSLSDSLIELQPSEWGSETPNDIRFLFELMFNQILARVAQEWEREIEYQTAILDVVANIADKFSESILAQSPESFTKGQSYELSLL
jgi:hypothetical protein